MKKTIKVLILFANPKSTPKLKLSKERKIIIKTLEKLLENHSKLQIKFVDDATIHDLREELLKGEFNVLQISGHGTDEGLILERENGTSHIIKPKALANLLKKYKSLECVIFNACYSIAQGKYTAAHIPFTIAMKEAIEDKAACEFSRGFYGAIATGKDYRFAFDEGCQNVELNIDNPKFHAEFLMSDSLSRDAIYEKKANPEANPAESGAVPIGNNLTAKGDRNVVIGGNVINSRFYLGDTTKDSKENN